MDTASLRRAYVARLKLYHFGFLSRTNKKVAIKSPVPTSAHTSEIWPSGILPRVRRKMPIINGTTTRKIASFFILVSLRGRFISAFVEGSLPENKRAFDYAARFNHTAPCAVKRARGSD